VNIKSTLSYLPANGRIKEVSPNGCIWPLSGILKH
jgi:hypothetical protein